MRIVHARAPARICDNGGWTDTWFAGCGRVCNLAVEPGAEVEVLVTARTGGAPAVVATAPSELVSAAAEEVPVPDDVSLRVRLASKMPAGSGTGTSAAAVVALVGALDRVRGGFMGPGELAAAAHRVETERLGLQSGVQDQLAAVHGGACYIEVERYPRAAVERVAVPDAVWDELERRLVLVYLGSPHESSAVHEQVIASLADGPDGAAAGALDALRAAAVAMRDALAAGDLAALGAALAANTDAQRALHPALVGPAARGVIEVAAAHGAAGWKVNGAGGDGGSVTVLAGPSPEDRRSLTVALEAHGGGVRTIPIRLSARGLRVWEDS